LALGEQAEWEFAEILHQPNTQVAELMRALRSFLGENDMMAYLVMMANRLLELHRVLKPTGSLYLHCDPTASHYIKVVLDGVFGKGNFRNEITWKRTSAHNDARRFGANTDIIFFYAKTDRYVFNPVYQPYSDEYKARFRNTDADGRRWADDNLTAKGLTGGGYEYEYKGARSLWRCPPETMARLEAEGRLHFTKNGGIRLKRYLDELPGMPCQALWDDISPINSQAAERLGYPTQKPLALLERIIQASSNEGDVVLDPFCGCGTAVHAAQKLNRRWIGIDITHLAISIIERRLREAFPGIQFKVDGTPKDLDGARELARRDKYQFQWWACALVGAQPYQGKKKGADNGVDGLIYFQDESESNKAKKIVVSVKGGNNVSVAMIRELKGVVEREKADIGLFVTLASPTKPMQTAAFAAGLYNSPYFKQQQYSRLQILTIEGLLNGTERAHYPDMSMGAMTFKKAVKEDQKAEQVELV
jgi:DNA modification methylase